MGEKQLSVRLTKEQLLKFNIYCKIKGKGQDEVVSDWIDTLPDYATKS